MVVVCRVRVFLFRLYFVLLRVMFVFAATCCVIDVVIDVVCDARLRCDAICCQGYPVVVVD